MFRLTIQYQLSDTIKMGSNNKLLLFPILTLYVLYFITSASADKILVASFISTKSQKITHTRLVEELAKRGHQLTVVSPVKSTKDIPNIREIYTLDMFQFFKQWNPFDEKQRQRHMPFLMSTLWDKVCRHTYDLPQVKQVMKESFDLIIVPLLFNDCVYALAYRLKAPLVIFSTFSVENFIVNRIGAHLPPSIVPSYLSELTGEMNFYERLLNFLTNVYVEAILKFYYEPGVAKMYREMLGEDIPDPSEIMNNASLILSNGHFSWTQPKPVYNDIIEVGGIHCRPAKALPKDMENFVTKKGSDGFILFSMGSAITASQMPEEKRKKFINVFKRLKQQVLWKWETETMPDLPENVKLSKWVPQQDVLGHPNIKLFITHCGMGGTEESVYHGVPLIGLPMFGDQPINAKRARDFGFLIELDWETLTESDLYDAIQEILSNSSYHNNVKKLSTIFKDQIDEPLFRGVWWIEYVLRHKGAPHLRSFGRKLNFFQYHSLDVIGLLLGFFLTIIYLMFIVIRWCCKKQTKIHPRKKKQ